MPVDRCVCFNITFAELKKYAQTRPDCGIDDLRERFGCTRGCALCLPYIQAMLATGRTEFSTDEDLHSIARPDVTRPDTYHGPQQRPVSPLPDYLEALARALRGILPLQRTEQVPLRQAGGCVLSEPVKADRDLPPFNRAQMDGYALRATEFNANPSRPWPVAATIPAGSPAPSGIPPGHCVAIATGAPLPGDVDTVIQHESSDRGDRNAGPVHFKIHSIAPGHAVHLRGADAKAGQTLIPSNTLLAAHHLGIAAAVGISSLLVRAKPRATVLTSGDEVVDIDAAIKPHQIRNSNGPQICELLHRLGAHPIDARHLPDDREQTIGAVSNALAKSDLLITIGGVSAGDRDHFPAAFTASNVTTSLQGASIQPGRPIYIGRAPNGAIVIGLPGNPVSALACACIFVWPIVRTLLGLPPDLPWRTVELAEPVKPNPGRRMFRPALLQPDGRALVPSWAGSGDLAHTAPTHGLIELPIQTEPVQAGARLRFLPWP